MSDEKKYFFDWKRECIKKRGRKLIILDMDDILKPCECGGKATMWEEKVVKEAGKVPKLGDITIAIKCLKCNKFTSNYCMDKEKEHIREMEDALIRSWNEDIAETEKYAPDEELFTLLASECPYCHKKHKIKDVLEFKDFLSGTVIKCNCGKEYKVMTTSIKRDKDYSEKISESIINGMKTESYK